MLEPNLHAASSLECVLRNPAETSSRSFIFATHVYFVHGKVEPPVHSSFLLEPPSQIKVPVRYLLGPVIASPSTVRGRQAISVNPLSLVLVSSWLCRPYYEVSKAVGPLLPSLLGQSLSRSCNCNCNRVKTCIIHVQQPKRHKLQQRIQCTAVWSNRPTTYARKAGI